MTPFGRNSIICCDRAYFEMRYKTIKVLRTALFLLFFLVYVFSKKCPNDAFKYRSIVSQQNSFTKYSFTEAYGVEIGSVSNNVYSAYYIYFPDTIVLRTTDLDNNLVWMKSVSLKPCIKGLSIDSEEKYVYLAGIMSSSILSVIRLQTTKGKIISSQVQ